MSLSTDRRTVFKAAAAAAVTALTPIGLATAQPAAPPRNRTMSLVWGGREGRWVDFELWNPYSIGSNHQNGPNIIYEPLAYYSAFADKTYMWLAESYQYTPDFKQLTIKTRSGITWSDGTPFSAEDVAFTLNSLRDLGPKVKWGVDVQQVMKEAKATDANTVVVDFVVPAPRFFFFMTYKYDIGVYIVPKHIFAGQDWTTFKHFDIAKGWPVSTGPWKVTEASLQQKVFDRRPEWWAAKAGLAPLPADRAYDLAASCGRTGDGAGADHQPVGCGDRYAAGDVPDAVPRQSEDHHAYRPEAALWLRRLVADLALRQQRGQAVRRQGRALGGVALRRPTSS